MLQQANSAVRKFQESHKTVLPGQGIIEIKEGEARGFCQAQIFQMNFELNLTLLE